MVPAKQKSSRRERQGWGGVVVGLESKSEEAHGQEGTPVHVGTTGCC